MFKVRYDSKTGNILEWGEIIQPVEGTGIIEVADDEMMGYLTQACRVENGKLVVDDVKIQTLKTMKIDENDNVRRSNEKTTPPNGSQSKNSG